MDREITHHCPRDSIIITRPNISLECKVWMRKVDGQSISVLSSQGEIDKSGRFYPKQNSRDSIIAYNYTTIITTFH